MLTRLARIYCGNMFSVNSDQPTMGTMGILNQNEKGRRRYGPDLLLLASVGVLVLVLASIVIHQTIGIFPAELVETHPAP